MCKYGDSENRLKLLSPYLPQRKRQALQVEYENKANQLAEMGRRVQYDLEHQKEIDQLKVQTSFFGLG
jgi:hypothetical protein